MHPIAADSSACRPGTDHRRRLPGRRRPAAGDARPALHQRRPGAPRAPGCSASRGVLLLVADVAYSLISLYGDDGGEQLLDAGWLLSYVAWAAAALHPSMRADRDADTAAADAPDAAAPAGAADGQFAARAGPAVRARSRRRRRRPHRHRRSARWCCSCSWCCACPASCRRCSGRPTSSTDLAMHDDLTGLANRRRFEQGVRAALPGGRAQVALLDLDDFKAVNDDLGHAVGDQLLVALGPAAGSSPCPATRWWPGWAATSSRCCCRTPPPPRRTWWSTGSPARCASRSRPAGTSCWSRPASAARTARAPTTRTRCCAAPTSRCTRPRGPATTHRRYAPELDEQASEQARLGAELRTALDAGQFRLVYQPIVALPDGRAVAVEALVRWEHPERGLVSPADFIPVAERNGLIVELGAWILRTACRQAAEWRAELGRPRPGPDQRQRLGPPARRARLRRPGRRRAARQPACRPTCLVVEVTETAVFDGGRARARRCTTCTGLGVRIALDDFGTGHSSLGPAADRARWTSSRWTSRSWTTSRMAGRHAVIATALIDISDGLDLTAVAEGVETAEQAGRAVPARLPVGPGLPLRQARGRTRLHRHAGRRTAAGGPGRHARSVSPATPARPNAGPAGRGRSPSAPPG